MTQRHILIFIISILVHFSVNSQQLEKEQVEEKEQDAVKTKISYAKRVGVDISKPIISFLQEDTKGLELTGDMRIANNYFAAVELGFEDILKTEDYLNFTTTGSYIKLGVNYNAYDNWIGMNNQIYIGARYAFSFFEHTLNSYTPNVSGTYFIPDSVNAGTNFTDLNAHWLEFLFGMKVETFKNLFSQKVFMSKLLLFLLASSRILSTLELSKPSTPLYFLLGINIPFCFSLSSQSLKLKVVLLSFQS